MRSLLRASFSRLLVSLILFSAFTLASQTLALAQTTSASSSAEAERARQRAEADLAFREWQLRNINKAKRVDVEVAPPTVTLGNIKEDYEGLQKANNSILTMLSGGKELDYKIISNASSEIRKRAARLKSYMVALEMVKDSEKRKKSPDEIMSAEVKPSLLSMDASIVRLVANPIFKNFGKVVDTDNSAKANDDLDNIIELSEKIKRSADRIMKETRASR